MNNLVSLLLWVLALSMVLAALIACVFVAGVALLVSGYRYLVARQ